MPFAVGRLGCAVSNVLGILILGGKARATFKKYLALWYTNFWLILVSLVLRGNVSCRVKKTFIYIFFPLRRVVYLFRCIVNKRKLVLMLSIQEAVWGEIVFFFDVCHLSAPFADYFLFVWDIIHLPLDKYFLSRRHTSAITTSTSKNSHKRQTFGVKQEM